MSKLTIRISNNPFKILAYIVCMLSIYAYFTVTSIPMVTYLLIGGVMFYAFASRALNKCVGNWYFLYICLLVVYVFFVGTVKVNMSGSTMMRSIIFQMIPCLVFFVFTMTEQRGMEKAFVWIALSVLVLCVSVLFDEALMETLKETSEEGAYYTFEENNRNTIAVILALGALYMLHLGVTENKLFLLLMLLPIVLGLITGSRKLILAVVVGVLLYTLLYSACCQKRNRKKLLPIVFAVAAVWGLLYACYNVELLYNIIGFRLEGLFETLFGGKNVEASAVERSHMIEKAFEMFLEKPILGWGIDGFAANTHFGVYSHNNYTEMLVSFGTIGFLFIYFFKFRLLWAHIHMLRNSQYEEKSDNARTVFLTVLMSVCLILDFAMISITDICTNVTFAFAAANRHFYITRLQTRGHSQ